MDPVKLTTEHPFFIEWKLKKCDLEALMSTKNGYLTSPCYFANKECDVGYFFVFAPYGLTDKTDGKAVIYCQIKLGNVKELKAKYTICIESVNFSKDVETVLKESNGCGVKLCKSGELFDSKNGYFVDDETIMLKVDGVLKFDRALIPAFSYPLSMQWSIKSTDLAVSGTNGFIQSKKFSLSSTSAAKYYLRIYPNGNKEETRGKVGIYLYLEQLEKEKRIETYITLSISSAKYSHNLCDIYEEGLGSGSIISSTDTLFDPMKKFIIDGEMMLSIRGKLFIKKKEPSFTLLGNPIKEFTTEKDYKLLVEGNKVKVHKELLIESSSYFAQKFSSKSKESLENRLIITGFELKIVKAAIKLLYGISPSFAIEDLIPLLHFCDKYDFDMNKNLIENKLIKKISESNVCQLIHFSTLFHASILNQKSTEFLIHCLRTSTPVNDLDLIDKELAYKLFTMNFCHNSI